MELKFAEAIEQKHLKKLNNNIVEARIPITREEVVTFNLEVFENDLAAAEESVSRRESELASAVQYRDTLLNLRVKLLKAK